MLSISNNDTLLVTLTCILGIIETIFIIKSGFLFTQLLLLLLGNPTHCSTFIAYASDFYIPCSPCIAIICYCNIFYYIIIIISYAIFIHCQFSFCYMVHVNTVSSVIHSFAIIMVVSYKWIHTYTYIYTISSIACICDDFPFTNTMYYRPIILVQQNYFLVIKPFCYAIPLLIANFS